jgi:hypothetical protein
MSNGQGKNLRSEKTEIQQRKLLFHCRSKEDEEGD